MVLDLIRCSRQASHTDFAKGIVYCIPMFRKTQHGTLLRTHGAKVLDNKVGVTFAKNIKTICRAVDAAIHKYGRACITADTAKTKLNR